MYCTCVPRPPSRCGGNSAEKTNRSTACSLSSRQYNPETQIETEVARIGGTAGRATDSKRREQPSTATMRPPATDRHHLTPIASVIRVRIQMTARPFPHITSHVPNAVGALSTFGVLLHGRGIANPVDSGVATIALPS